MSVTALRESELRGGRWLYDEPTPTDVREWFEQQPIHDGMAHGRYASGVVLIPASEKYWPQHEQADGTIAYLEQHRRTWTPYVSVSTRVNYFWDYIMLLNHGRIDGQFRGEIEPVSQRVIEDGPLANAHLPEGFSQYAVMQGQNMVSYIVCTMRVSIIQTGGNVRGGDSVVRTVEDARQIPAADPYALMKARTAAVGRALGLAGMLVIGTGVASAEEVQDAINPPGARPADFSQARLPDLPAEQPFTDQELRERVRALRGTLTEAARGAFDAWYAERGFGPLEDLARDKLDIIFRKLERDVDADVRN